ncbi:flippase [Cellulophaga sp. Ld12]|uniref:flippase n=1 Tax=Cellulophaga sp. Ld12 TaxID=3229535 RepID=UPI00386EB1B1
MGYKTIKKGIIINALWAIVSKLLSGLKLIIIGVIVARQLGPDEFGAYSYTISFVMLLSVLAEFRLHNILIREISKDEINTEKILGSAFITCLFFSIIGYITLLILVNFIEEDSELRFYILIYGLTYFFQTLRFLRAFFIAKFHNKTIFKIEIIVGLLVLLTAGIVSLYSNSILLYILIRMFDLLMVSLLLIMFYQIGFKKVKQWKFDKKISKELIINSSPLVLSSLALVIFQQFDQIMIKHLLNEYSVGQYSAAVSIIGLIVFIPMVLTDVISPSLIKSKINSKSTDYLNKLQLFSDYITWGSIILCILITFLSPIIVNLIYGDKYLDSIEILKVFTWQSVFIAMGAVAAQIMIIDNKHQVAYIKSLAAGILNIVLNFIWIPKYGIMGAVWASLVAYVTSSYIAHFFIKRYKYIFFIQTKSLFYGLVNIFNDLKTINRKNDD